MVNTSCCHRRRIRSGSAIGQPYAGVYLRTFIGSARIKQDFGDNWHLVAGILNQTVQRNINTAVNNLTSNAGAYTTSFGAGFAPRFAITSDTAYLDGTFNTGSIGHDLTFGSAGYRASSYSPITTATPASLLLGTASIDAPVIYPEPAAGTARDVSFRATSMTPRTPTSRASISTTP